MGTLTIPVAHDFTCGWSWVALAQARRLEREFDVKFEWRGYEMNPYGVPFDPPTVQSGDPRRPLTPTRFDLICELEGVSRNSPPRPFHMRTHSAHEALEFARSVGRHDEMLETLYRAYWERGEAIEDFDVLDRLARAVVPDPEALLESVRSRRFADRIGVLPCPEDDVYCLSTFHIAGKPYAEQPSSVLRRAIAQVAKVRPAACIYDRLAFPEPPSDRPYLYLNMVATLDGKILGGNREDGTVSLGSKVDQTVMRRLEALADLTLVGAETLRKAGAWSPRSDGRAVVTRSGDLPWSAKFFREGRAYVVAPEAVAFDLPSGVTALHAGREKVDLAAVLRGWREHGIGTLLCMGGGELNAELLRLNVVDEIFLTIAPKVKMGRNIPTLAEGEPFDLAQLPRFRLLEHHVADDELFLRYRREAA